MPRGEERESEGTEQMAEDGGDPRQYRPAAPFEGGSGVVDAPDRRQSVGDETRASRSSSTWRNTDGDAGLEALAIADGGRPPSGIRHHDSPRGRLTPPPRPSSTTKPRPTSFALRHDGAMGPAVSRDDRAVSASNTVLSRSSSISTDPGFVRPERPYQGPGGPSHPYQMFPQESRSTGTMSMATIPAIPISERSYAGPDRPIHPYGMFPQTVAVEDDGDDGEDEHPPILAGFPGLNNSYHRHLDSQGEGIADIVGPDGHREQLPPYSQYPENSLARKARHGIQIPPPGAGGIGLATRNPEFASREDLSTPESPQSTHSPMSDSNQQMGTAGPAVSEKPELKRWQRIARRKVCGIVPIWAIVLVGSTFAIFTIILASVLAALLPRHPPTKHHLDGNETLPQSIVTTAVTMTTTFDASPFTTLPSHMPTLPTGTFQLPLMTPTAAPSGCIGNEGMRDAWSCALPSLSRYQIAISNTTGPSNSADREVTLNLSNNTSQYLQYGAQPPALDRAQLLNLAKDDYDSNRGPAWFFQTLYDKLVILPEVALTPSNTRRAETFGDSDSSFGGLSKEVVQAGDKPWFCYWNGTLLEAFIYINETSNAGMNASSSIRASATATTTAPSGPPVSGAPSSNYPEATAEPAVLPCYPKVVKIEEHRIPLGSETIPAYCVQQHITEDGSPQPYFDDFNEPVTIYLNETEPTVVAPVLKRHTLFHDPERSFGDLGERLSGSSCGCIWLAQ